jgi:adenylate kinase family enzyme
MTSYRRTACGNRTRFDVYDTVRRKRFEHADLGGDVTVEDEEVLDRIIDRIICRWCDSSESVVTNQPAADTDR